MNITVPMLDDDLPSEDDDDQGRIRPAIYLPTRMLADAIPAAMDRDLRRIRLNSRHLALAQQKQVTHHSVLPDAVNHISNQINRS